MRVRAGVLYLSDCAGSSDRGSAEDNSLGFLYNKAGDCHSGAALVRLQ